MSINIPQAGGVPGISGPPDWFPPGGNYDLDDVRWRGAAKNSFGAGASGGNSVRAIQATVGGQQFIYLSFRAAFVPSLSNQYDTVYLGLHRTGGTKAMVIQMQVHGTGFTPAGPPSGNPPAILPLVQIWTRASADPTATPDDLKWGVPPGSGTPQPIPPSWIATNARAWLQSATDVPTDPNNRWAIQLRIPAAALGDIATDSGPNLGTDFNMWYLIHGTMANGDPLIVAEYPKPSVGTAEGKLQNAKFPLPFAPGGVWEQYLVTTGPASFGGVSLEWGDVVVQNTLYTEGWKIANGQPNTFVARPRNYRTAGSTINPGDIQATFRIAEWGSVMGDPNQTDFATGVWSYVPGNSRPGTVPGPVVSAQPIPTIMAGANPPTSGPNGNPIPLGPVTVTLGPGKSLHQCILATLSGTNLQFLTDSIFQNMNFDTASLVERDAKISVVTSKKRSKLPRQVCLAVEKINMPSQTPPGTDEGRFLQSSMDRLIRRGGLLGRKLRSARAQLGRAGDCGSGQRLEAILDSLRGSLIALKYQNSRNRDALNNQLLGTVARLVSVVKETGKSSEQVAALCQALEEWSFAPAAEQGQKLKNVTSHLGLCLERLGSDPHSVEAALTALVALRDWTSNLKGGQAIAAAFLKLEAWLRGDRSASAVPALTAAFRKALPIFFLALGKQRMPIASFLGAIGLWIKGHERLQTLVATLAEVGLTTAELDELFPTVRVHVYYDTGERVKDVNGKQRAVWREQSSFGTYAYHEGSLEGWLVSIQGAKRIAENVYMISTPASGVFGVRARVQAVGREDERIREEPIARLRRS